MAFYDLPKEHRQQLVTDIHERLLTAYKSCTVSGLLILFSDEDTYIRKAAYLETGKIFFQHPQLEIAVLQQLQVLSTNDDFKVRQTAINAAGEIGKVKFDLVQHFFDAGLHDIHHSPRNAVIGSIKKMGQVNPIPVLSWAAQYLHHEDKEIRREICHGIELRGRTHPEDILPLLRQLEFDKTARVLNTLVHVIGQIAYKKGCLEKVVADIKNWANQELVTKALAEIIDVHHRYRDFSFYTQAEAKQYIEQNY